MSRCDQRGFTVVELVCAFAVLSVLALSLVHTGHGKAQSTARAFHETLALRLCQAQLEGLRAGSEPLVAGEQPFALLEGASSLPAGRGVRLVRRVAPQLYEVEVEVRWLPAGAPREAVVRLATRVLREEGV